VHTKIVYHAVTVEVTVLYIPVNEAVIRTHTHTHTHTHTLSEGTDEGDMNRVFRQEYFPGISVTVGCRVCQCTVPGIGVCL
jgi:hypothetical protein